MNSKHPIPSPNGGLKVRHYILDLLYQHPGEAIKIPSSIKLAAMFGVARSTVTLVLKDLIRRGYLKGKKGVGTFACYSGFSFPDEKPTPMIGMILGDGKLYFHDAFTWRLPAYAGIELTRKNYSLRYLSLNGDSEGEVFEEIGQQRLDGLVWLIPGMAQAKTRLFERLQSAGIALVVVQFDAISYPKRISSVLFDFYGAGVALGKALIKENRRSLFFLFENSSTTTRLKGIRDAFRNAGVTLKAHVFTYTFHESFRQLEEALVAGNVPDAIFVFGEHTSTVLRLLGKHHVDMVSRCRILSESHRLVSEMLTTPIPSIAMEIPFGKLGEHVATLMEEGLRHPGHGRSILLECPVRMLGR
jgi:DNA-binding LacI/PurR family transcriptional regulator